MRSMDKLTELDEMGFRANPVEKLVFFTKMRVRGLSYRQALVVNSVDYLPEYKSLHINHADYSRIVRRNRSFLLCNETILREHFLIKNIPVFPCASLKTGDMRVNYAEGEKDG